MRRKPKKTLETLGIKLKNEKLTPERLTAHRTPIEDNSDLFATTLAEVGTTDLILHEINTGNAASIRQRCYNQSRILHQRSIDKLTNS